MNKKYLGDELDHWKGSLISILSRDDFIHNLAVEPMVTDSHPWPKEKLLTYRRILMLPIKSMICHSNKTFTNRQNYFDDIPKRCDLFVDPDTGISLTNRGKKYITIPEIARFLENGDQNRVLMIYQHFRRKPFSKWFRQISPKMGNNISYCAYQGRQAAMLFISRNKRRIESIKSILEGHLNGAGRKILWGTA